MNKMFRYRLRSYMGFAGLLLALLLVIALPVHAAENPWPLINVLFQNHVVLQRNRTVPVWGRANPGETVTVSIDGEHASAQADSRGHWEVELPPLHAGGPYMMVAKTSDGTRQVIHDVLVGDVWLCAGQSNMQLPVHRTYNERAVIANAHNNTIRMLTVSRYASSSPLSSVTVPVKWEKTNPQTVGDFSATCYYFARGLQKKIHVPIGLINASLGGSRIQAWMSAAALRKVGGYDKALDALAEYGKNRVVANANWGKVWEAWWRNLPGVKKSNEPWNPDLPIGSGWHKAPKGLGGYHEWGIPKLAHFTGMLWFRTKVKLTAKQAAQPATLDLGEVDEIDETWVNGHAVGGNYIGTPRHYKLPKGLLHAGTNVIVVNNVNTYLDGGLVGPPSTRALRLADGTSVSLSKNPWFYRIVPASFGMPPLPPWSSSTGLTTLYNGMIAPLGNYAVRGEIWYQGASNTYDASSYAKLLRAFRKQMRNQFGPKLPFLIVQISDYGLTPTHPGPSGMAEVREAERNVAADDPRSGLAVTIDLGDRYFIHFANKQQLGHRLVHLARQVAYGHKELSPSGPIPLSAKRKGSAVIVRFGDVAKGLIALGSNHPVGFELCGARSGSCEYATAKIKGDRVILHASNARSATRVRYGWAGTPVVTLFDGARMPAGPFEMPIQ